MKKKNKDVSRNTIRSKRAGYTKRWQIQTTGSQFRMNRTEMKIQENFLTLKIDLGLNVKRLTDNYVYVYLFHYEDIKASR